MNRFLSRAAAFAVVLSILCACSAKERAVPLSSALENAVSESASASSAESEMPVDSSQPEPESSKEEPLPTLQVKVGGTPVSITAGGELSTLEVGSVESLPVFSTPGAQCQITYGERAVFSGSTESLSEFNPAQNGVYTYEVVLPEGTHFKWNMNLNLPIKLTVPTTACQGETLLIRADFADGVSLTAESGLNFSPQFFADGGSQIALLPIRYTTTPGVYPLTIQAGQTAFHYDIQVDQREFEIQRLTMDPGTAAETALSAQANAEWEQKIEPLKKICDPQRYWENPFLQPVQGEITTEFGCIRYTNENPTPSRHSGIDIATKEGTPVLAANNGRVLFADFLQLTGNTVIIEHGFGLKSFHYHMSSLNVKAGDMVQKGQQIGAVGTTGYSTGPHLHYALAVNQVFVNPWTAFETGI